MSPTLTLSLRSSRILALALTLIAGAALACAWASLPDIAFLPVAAGIVLALVWHIPETLQRGKRAVRTLQFKAQGAVRWQDGSGQWHEAQILPSSYVCGWLVVLNLGANGRLARSVVLLPDCADAEELRRLRVWLRWRPGTG